MTSPRASAIGLPFSRTISSASVSACASMRSKAPRSTSLRRRGAQRGPGRLRRVRRGERGERVVDAGVGDGGEDRAGGGFVDVEALACGGAPVAVDQQVGPHADSSPQRHQGHKEVWRPAQGRPYSAKR